MAKTDKFIFLNFTESIFYKIYLLQNLSKEGAEVGSLAFCRVVKIFGNEKTLRSCGVGAFCGAFVEGIVCS